MAAAYTYVGQPAYVMYNPISVHNQQYSSINSRISHIVQQISQLKLSLTDIINSRPSNERVSIILEVLKGLRQSPLDIQTDILGASSKFPTHRDGFYRGRGLERFLNTVKADKRGETQLEEWFGSMLLKDVASKTVEKELRALTPDFVLVSDDITPKYLLDFSLESITSKILQKAPTTHHIILSACSSQVNGAKSTADFRSFCTIVFSMIMKKRNPRSQTVAFPSGFFFHSTGTAKKAFDVMNHIGLTPSYRTIYNTNRTLADGQIGRARVIARQGHSLGWDNNQISLTEHAEQRTDGPSKVQTGTSAIIYPLVGTTPTSLLLDPIVKNLRSPTLRVLSYNRDIRPSISQLEEIHRHQCIAVVHILMDHVDGFDYLENSLQLKYPSYIPPVPKHKTEEYVLRTTTIDEGSVEGTIQVAENIFMDQLAFKYDELDHVATPSYNDQKTNSLIRAAQLLRRRDVSAILRLQNLQLAPGLFHLQLNLLWSILATHRGNGSEPGSLQYYIGLLGRKRLGQEHPDYETLRSFLMQVFIGHILHCWEVECNSDLNCFVASKPSAETLIALAGSLIRSYASDCAVETHASRVHSDDCTTRNFVLFNRDMLLFHVLDLGISSGDFGRVEILLGRLTEMFCGANSKNYTSELLFLLQNLRYVWPASFADVMRKNALISTSGRDGHYVGVDKNIEFNINYEKAFFAAKGIHASWDQLADLSPNIPIYRHLKKTFGLLFGAPWNGSTHSHVDVSKEIEKVKARVDELELQDPFIIRQDTVLRSSVNVCQLGRERLERTVVKRWAKRYEEFRAAKVSSSSSASDIIDSITNGILN